MTGPRFLACAIVFAFLLTGFAAPGGSSRLGHSHSDSAPSTVAPTPSAFSPAVNPLAGGVTIIRPDGSISNTSTPITLSGTNYTVTAGFTGSIVDERNGSTLIGGGKDLNQSSLASQAIEVVNASNVVVTGFAITNGSVGILVVASASVTVTGNTVQSTLWAFKALQASWVSFTNNVAPGTQGILADVVTGINVTGNNLHGSISASTELYLCTDARVEHNLGYGSAYGLDLSSVQRVRVWGNNYSSSPMGIFASGVNQLTVSWNSLSFATTGILLQTSDGVTGTSNSGRNSTVGIEIISTSDVALANESFPGSTSDGLVLEDARNATSTFSDFRTSGTGVFIDTSQNVLIAHDNLSHYVGSGITVDNSFAVNLSGNEMQYTSGTAGAAIASYDDQQLTVRDNDAPGAVIAYSDLSSTGISVTGNSFRHSKGTQETIYLRSDSNVAIVGNDLFNASSYALEAFTTQSLTVVGNNMSYAGIAGAWFLTAQRLVVSDNRIDHARTIALALEQAIGVTVSGNELDVGGPGSDGLILLNVQDGMIVNNSATRQNLSVEAVASLGLIVRDNNVSQSWIGLLAADDSNCSFVGNQLWADHFAFELQTLTAVTLDHNNFISDSGWLVFPLGSSSVALDAGYPGGGNYWSNHTGPDSQSGPGQNHSGSDGIVDTPVKLTAPEVDRYPLASPWVTYTVTFVEHGLSPGAVWGVVVNGTAYRSATSQIVYPQPTAAPSSYRYYVEGLNGFTATPASGTGPSSRSNVSVAITFAPLTYLVSFQASGLPNGTGFNLTFQGGRLSTASGTLTVSIGNGTYPYTVGSSGDFTASPSSGTVTVSGSAKTVAIAFQPFTYPVEFAQSGLAGSTTWSVTLNGQPQSSTGAVDSFALGNGTYSYTIGAVGGYSVTPTSGVVTVGGGGYTITVLFAANPAKTYGSSTVYALGGGLVAALLLAAVAVALLMRGRRKPPALTTPAPPSGAVPAATPAPVPAAPPPSPPPGASGAGAPPWKES